jgi:hypothetical protein
MLLINVNLELLLRAKNCSALFTFGLVFRHTNILPTYNLCIALGNEATCHDKYNRDKKELGQGITYFYLDLV